MSYHVFNLSDFDREMGITLEQVAEIVPQCLLRDEDGQLARVIIPVDVSPALASAVARCALGGEVDYRGLNLLGMPVYRKAR